MIRIYKGKYFDVNALGIEFSIEFKMTLELDEEFNFIGTVWEQEFSEISNLEGLVKGFIENEHISFVLTYPCFYGCDENDQIIIDKSKPGHDVIYDGFWDSESQSWIGEWEIEGPTEISFLDQIKTEVIIGNFQMKLV